jgi:hypothetical protein
VLMEGGGQPVGPLQAALMALLPPTLPPPGPLLLTVVGSLMASSGAAAPPGMVAYLMFDSASCTSCAAHSTAAVHTAAAHGKQQAGPVCVAGGHSARRAWLQTGQS